MFIPVFFAARRRFSSSSRVPKLTRGASARPFDTRRFVLLNITREKRRALCEVMILACALCVLGTTQLFRQRAVSDPSERSSGTGGFSYYGELNSGIPAEQANAEFLRGQGIVIDGIGNNTNANINDVNINTDTGINTNAAIDAANSKFISVCMRVKDGDDASCLNLNQTSAPVLFGVNQFLLDELGAFSFASIFDIGVDTGAVDKHHPWLILGSPANDRKTVYGIADANTIEWGLGKTLGDTLTYIDESGGTLSVVLAASLKNSILQGKVIIAESDFIRHYPSISGYRALLLSMPTDLAETISDALISCHDKNGLFLEPAAERLGAFNSVENTYLSIFAVLGMMGLALGCAGMGIAAARNVEERRGGLALLMAQGFPLRMIRRVLFAEHAAVALAGTLLGLLPAVAAFGAAFNLASLARIVSLLAIVFLCGAGSILLGLRGLKKQDLLAVLKDEL
jgi:ABC-type antimicrobial peptide transport system permease subunit